MREKTFYIKTFGCQMNERDSERLTGFLSGKYSSTDEINKADIVLINTCAIREKSEQKVYSLLGKISALKKKKPGLIVGLAGCVAQIKGEAILKNNTVVDFVIGPQGIPDIVDVIEETRKRGKVSHLKTEIDEVRRFEVSQFRRISKKVNSFITIMEGCNNFCSYCIVPYTRGSEVSRKPDDILDEVKRCSEDGIKEVTLLGQNVNSYKYNFPLLIKKISEIDGIERIRFITSHPAFLDDMTIELFGITRKLCEHIHLPIQSGSDRILALMNRQYTRRDFILKIEKLRDVCKDISITTDIIVGFPGENEDDFRDTVSLLKDLEFDNIFSFKFSPRGGTPAAFMKEQIPDELKTERILEVQNLQKMITIKKNKMLIKKVIEVLVEDFSLKNKNEVCGRTRCNRIVNFNGTEEDIGRFINVEILEAYQNSLRGKKYNGGEGCLLK